MAKKTNTNMNVDLKKAISALNHLLNEIERDARYFEEVVSRRAGMDAAAYHSMNVGRVFHRDDSKELEGFKSTLQRTQNVCDDVASSLDVLMNHLETESAHVYELQDLSIIFKYGHALKSVSMALTHAVAERKKCLQAAEGKAVTFSSGAENDEDIEYAACEFNAREEASWNTAVAIITSETDFDRRAAEVYNALSRVVYPEGPFGLTITKDIALSYRDIQRHNRARVLCDMIDLVNNRVKELSFRDLVVLGLAIGESYRRLFICGAITDLWSRAHSDRR